MSETTNPVVDLPVKPSALKRWTKRALITTVVAGAAALVYAKVTGDDGETVNESVKA